MEAPLTERVARALLRVSFAAVQPPAQTQKPPAAGARFLVSQPVLDAAGTVVGMLTVGDAAADSLPPAMAALLPEVASLALIEAVAADGRVSAHEAVNALTTLSWYAWLLEKGREPAGGRLELLHDLAAEARVIRLGHALT